MNTKEENSEIVRKACPFPSHHFGYEKCDCNIPSAAPKEDWKEQEKELFTTHSELAGKNGYCNPVFANKIADYWLSRMESLLSSYKQELWEKLREKAENTAQLGMAVPVVEIDALLRAPNE